MEPKEVLTLEESSRDTIIGFLSSYITCLEGILEDRQEQLKNTEYKLKKLRSEKTTKKSDIEFLEEELSSINTIIGFTKGETISVQDTIQKLRILTYCVIRPATISQAKTEISQKTGAPESIIEVEIDHATPVYTQYSLRNRFDVYEKAIHKEKVADFYRFPSITFEE